jgi:hypothetical protein
MFAIKQQENDPVAQNITKLCESTIRDALIADIEKDSLSAQLNKVKSPVEIALCGFRSLPVDDKQNL